MMLSAIIMVAAALAPDSQSIQPVERARANLGSYFSTDDYPMSAVARGAEGTVRFELEIGTDGRVSRCSITGSSGDADLDTTTCTLLSSRATYSPARDGEGRAIVGTDRGSVTWRLPNTSDDDGTHHPTFAPMQLATTMRLTADGTVTCNFAYNGQLTRLDVPDQCAIFGGSGAEEALRSLGGDTELTLIFTVLPSGATPAAGMTARGEIVFDTSVTIEVAADGSVASCRLTEGHISRPLSGLRGLPDLCRTYQMGGRPAFQPDPRQEGLRHGRLRSALYLRTVSPTRP